MQAGPDLENPKRFCRKFRKPAPTNPRPIRDIDMMQNSANSRPVESDTDAPSLIQAKSQKKKAKKSPENCPNPQPSLTQIKPTRTEEDQASLTAPSNTQPGRIPRAAKTIRATAYVWGTWVEKCNEEGTRKSTVRDWEERRNLRAYRKSSRWCNGSRDTGDIEAHNINHIVNAILDFALLEAQLVEKLVKKRRMEKKTASHKKLQAQPNQMRQLSFQTAKALGKLSLPKRKKMHQSSHHFSNL